MTAVVHPTDDGYQLPDGSVIRIWSGTTDKGNLIRLHVFVVELTPDHNEALPPYLVRGVDPQTGRG